MEKSEKAVLELALLTKKAARSHALQEHNRLQCEQDRAAGLEFELEHRNAATNTLLHERNKDNPDPNA